MNVKDEFAALKPFLGFDYTQDEENEIYNGEEFIVCRPSDALRQEQQRSADQFMDALNKSKLHPVLGVAKWVCGLGSLGGILTCLSVIIEEEDVTLRNAWQAAPWLFWLLALMALIFVVLYLMGKQKYQEVMESAEQKQKDLVADQIAEAVRRELRIPDDAKEVELLSFGYQMNEGKMEFYEVEGREISFENMSYDLFSDEGNIYIADGEAKYGFPKSSLKKIHTVKERGFVFWMQETPCNKGGYKPYKMYEDKFGNAHFKYYHILELECKGARWGIYFPCYELPIMEEITGLKAE